MPQNSTGVAAPGGGRCCAPPPPPPPAALTCGPLLCELALIQDVLLLLPLLRLLCRCIVNERAGQAGRQVSSTRGVHGTGGVQARAACKLFCFHSLSSASFAIGVPRGTERSACISSAQPTAELLLRPPPAARTQQAGNVSRLPRQLFLLLWPCTRLHMGEDGTRDNRRRLSWQAARTGTGCTEVQPPLVPRRSSFRPCTSPPVSPPGWRRNGCHSRRWRLPEPAQLRAGPLPAMAGVGFSGEQWRRQRRRRRQQQKFLCLSSSAQCHTHLLVALFTGRLARNLLLNVGKLVLVAVFVAKHASLLRRWCRRLARATGSGARRRPHLQAILHALLAGEHGCWSCAPAPRMTAIETGCEQRASQGSLLAGDMLASSAWARKIRHTKARALAVSHRIGEILVCSGRFLVTPSPPPALPLCASCASASKLPRGTLEPQLHSCF